MILHATRPFESEVLVADLDAATAENSKMSPELETLTPQRTPCARASLALKCSLHPRYSPCLCAPRISSGAIHANCSQIGRPDTLVDLSHQAIPRTAGSVNTEFDATSANNPCSQKLRPFTTSVLYESRKTCRLDCANVLPIPTLHHLVH